MSHNGMYVLYNILTEGLFDQLLICNFAGCDETDAILRNRRSFYISTGRHVPKRELKREPVKEMTHFAVSQVFVQSPV